MKKDRVARETRDERQKETERNNVIRSNSRDREGVERSRMISLGRTRGSNSGDCNVLRGDARKVDPPAREVFWSGEVDTEEAVARSPPARRRVPRRDENYLPRQAANCFQEKAILVLVIP